MYCSCEVIRDDQLLNSLVALFNSAAGTALLADWPVRTVRTLVAQSEDQTGTLAA